LDKMDGRIPRKRNPQLCHHNVHGKCLHCIPIEPYDEEFLKNRNPPIKHMSFRAYIRKLQSSAASDSIILREATYAHRKLNVTSIDSSHQTGILSVET
ncbi:unnamed protein product, partial [Rotaria sordida]